MSATHRRYWGFSLSVVPRVTLWGLPCTLKNRDALIYVYAPGYGHCGYARSWADARRVVRDTVAGNPAFDAKRAQRKTAS